MIFIFLAAVFCAIGDTLKSKFTTSIFRKLNPEWWNPDVSWVYKWAKGSTTKERFFGSSTFLVFLTDAFHLSRSIMITCIALAVVFPVWHVHNIFLYFLCLKLIWGIGFELTWRVVNK